MIDYVAQQGWGRIRLIEPEKKNKLSTALLCQLEEMLKHLAAQPWLHYLSIESPSDDIFAAGADMNELLALTPESAVAYAALGQRVMALVQNFPKPVFALVVGPCFGGAFDLALSCDYIMAAKNAQFCHPSPYLGIVTGFGGTVRLPRRIHAATARMLLTLGKRIDADFALRVGLAQRVFAHRHDMMAFMRQVEKEIPKWPKRPLGEGHLYPEPAEN